MHRNLSAKSAEEAHSMMKLNELVSLACGEEPFARISGHVDGGRAAVSIMFGNGYGADIAAVSGEEYEIAVLCNGGLADDDDAADFGGAVIGNLTPCGVAAWCQRIREHASL